MNTPSIYIDYTTGIGKSSNSFHGGYSFTIWLTKELIKLKSEINILLRENQLDFIRTEFNDKVNYIPVEQVQKFIFPKNSILIFPLIPNYKLYILKRIKNNNRSTKIYTVIHGLRNIDLIRYDKYDRYYLKGIFYLIPFLFCLYKLVKYIIEYYSVKFFLHKSDFVLTVSNSTLQKIISINKKINKITLFHQFTNTINNHFTFEYQDKKYILFLSSNRLEKNFSRTLLAFISFKIDNPEDNTYLYVTGYEKYIIDRLIKNLNTREKQIFYKYVSFFEYVDSNQLASLYRNSYFLLYTSKSEGYGIPVLESCLFGRPVVASYITSIPEVLGSLTYYVNPYDLNSIKEGIEFMCNSNNNMKRVQKIKEYNEVVIKRNKIENEMLFMDMNNY